MLQPQADGCGTASVPQLGRRWAWRRQVVGLSNPVVSALHASLQLALSFTLLKSSQTQARLPNSARLCPGLRSAPFTVRASLRWASGDARAFTLSAGVALKKAGRRLRTLRPASRRRHRASAPPGLPFPPTQLQACSPPGGVPSWRSLYMQRLQRRCVLPTMLFQTKCC